MIGSEFQARVWHALTKIPYGKTISYGEIAREVNSPKAVRAVGGAVALARTMHRAYLEGCVGQTYPVLYEQEKDGLYTGHAPNYCEVCVRAEDLHNKIIDTKIVGIDGDALIGELT